MEYIATSNYEALRSIEMSFELGHRFRVTSCRNGWCSLFNSSQIVPNAYVDYVAPFFDIIANSSIPSKVAKTLLAPTPTSVSPSLSTSYWQFFGQTFGIILLVLVTIVLVFAFIYCIGISICFTLRHEAKKRFKANEKRIMSSKMFQSTIVDETTKYPIIMRQPSTSNQAQLTLAASTSSPIDTSKQKTQTKASIRLSNGCMPHILKGDSIALGNHWINDHPEYNENQPVQHLAQPDLHIPTQPLPPPLPAGGLNPFKDLIKMN